MACTSYLYHDVFAETSGSGVVGRGQTQIYKTLRSSAIWERTKPNLGNGKGVITKGVFSLEDSLESLNSQRAQRSKKYDLDRNFQSRSNFLISLENFDLDVSISPQKIGPRWVARSKISFSIEIFNLDRNLEFF